MNEPFGYNTLLDPVETPSSRWNDPKTIKTSTLGVYTIKVLRVIEILYARIRCKCVFYSAFVTKKEQILDRSGPQDISVSIAKTLLSNKYRNDITLHNNYKHGYCLCVYSRRNNRFYHMYTHVNNVWGSWVHAFACFFSLGHTGKHAKLGTNSFHNNTSSNKNIIKFNCAYFCIFRALWRMFIDPK